MTMVVYTEDPKRDSDGFGINKKPSLQGKV